MNTVERLTIATSFQKSIDILKNTECSQHDKLLLFTQIADYIQSPALRNNSNYLNFVSNAITILLMFCEDVDSVTRMSAEENLNRIIRFTAPSNIVRTQYDLFHEIKKNGNERSLRICLNIFAYYCHLIKQRKAKPYALNLLPCILSISKRKEQLLIESLSEFMQTFCEYLEICLNENEVVKLVEAFIGDACMSECTVKRRCSANNVILLIEHSRRPQLIAKHALFKTLEILMKEYTPTTIIGVLGLLRILLPLLLSRENSDTNVIHKIIEIFEICLHLLQDSNHTIVNASLECICIILENPKPVLKRYLTNFRHVEVLRKKKTLKNLIFSRKSSAYSNEIVKSINTRMSSASTPRKIGIESARLKINFNLDEDSEVDSMKGNTSDIGKERKRKDSLIDGELNFPQKVLDESTISTASTLTANDERALLTCSDIEMDSFRSVDSEMYNTCYDSASMQSPSRSMHREKSAAETGSLRSQKSTESIGSFFNSILSHPNTESVSKFFRVGSTPTVRTDSTPATPKFTHKIEEKHLVRSPEIDDLSVISLDSQLSASSHMSTSFDVINKADENLPEIEILTDQDIDAIKVERKSADEKKYEADQSNISIITNPDQDLDQCDNLSGKEIYIGHITDQPLIYYTVRLIASKFLLAGAPESLISDKIVRISIKNLSLLAVAHSTALCPVVLLLPLEKLSNDYLNELNEIFADLDNMDEDDKEENTEEFQTAEQRAKSIPETDEVDGKNQLVIKDDHFGENKTMTNTYFDFCSPLSKSADNILLSRLSRVDQQAVEQRSSKLNSELTDLLSKSDIVESNRDYCEFSETVRSTPVDSRSKANKSKQIDSFSTANRIDALNFKFNMKLDEPVQFIEDVMLFWNHSDPILRANIQLLAGNFMVAALSDYSEISALLSINEIKPEFYKFLNLHKLLDIFLKGLTDEIHVVVKQSLLSFEILMPTLLNRNYLTSSPIGTVLPFESEDSTRSQFSAGLLRQTIVNILEQMILVFENKYWVVQCKCSEIIARMDYHAIDKIYDIDLSHKYEQQFVSQLYLLLSESDPRTRNVAAASISKYVQSKYNRSTLVTDDRCRLIDSFVDECVFKDLPSPLHFIKTFLSESIDEEQTDKELTLGRCLYILSNMLLELNSKDQQFGVIKALTELINAFNPVTFYPIWNEFNILLICLNYLNKNFSVATDLSCQCDLIEICSNLLAGSSTSALNSKMKFTSTVIEPEAHGYVSSLLSHILKILNIFHHVFSNQLPIFIPKGQKADIFINAKEAHQLNSFGYFGNDYFYLRIYKFIRVSYDNYKITINTESGSKMLQLLRTCLNSLSILLEIHSVPEKSESFKLIEEIVQYLQTFMNFVPRKCVICIKQLLKFMFTMNYINRRYKYEYLLNDEFRKTKDLKIIFEYLRTFKRFNEADSEKEGEQKISTPTKLIGKIAGSSKDSKIMGNSNIKLFEPIVIQCLKLFTKSNAILQSSILDMLCQVLEFKISYCLLDSNNVFIDFILKLLELVETGIVRDSHIVIPNIIKFLFYLSKQKEKKIVIVPKIINITDTLLANSVTMNGCIEALKELAYEFYFQQDVDVTSNDFRATRSNNLEMDLYRKELSTQKEVAFSMLLKFVYAPEIQKVVGLILLKEKENLSEMESELVLTILQMISEKKIVLTEISAYRSLNHLISIISKETLLDGKTLDQILKQFITLSERKPVTFNELAFMSIIFEHILLKCNETNLVQCATLKNAVKEIPTSSATLSVTSVEDYLAQLISQTIKQSIDSDSNNLPSVVQTNDKICSMEKFFSENEIMTYLQILSKYIELVQQVLNRFRKIKEYLQISQNSIGSTLQLLVEFSKQIPREIAIGYKENFEAELWLVLQLFFEYLFSIDCDKNSLLKQLNEIGCEKKSMPLDKCNRMIKHSFLTFVVEHMTSEDWTLEQLASFLENHLSDLFSVENGEWLLKNLVSSSEFSKLLVTELAKIAARNQNFKMHRFILSIVEVADINANAEVFSLLVNNYLMDPKRAEKSIKRCAIAILTKKLRKLYEKHQATDNFGKEANEVEQVLPSELFSVLYNISKEDAASIPMLNLKEILDSISRFYEHENVSITPEKMNVVDEDEVKKAVINEEWFIEQAEYNAFNCQISKQKICEILFEIKSESKLRKIFNSKEFKKELIPTVITYSFEVMTTKLKQDCFQFNPHMNYLKIPPILKQAIATLLVDAEFLSSDLFSIAPEIKADSGSIHSHWSQTYNQEVRKKVKLKFADREFRQKLTNIANGLSVLLMSMDALERICLVYVEANFVERFFKDNLLIPKFHNIFIKISFICALYIRERLADDSNEYASNDIENGKIQQFDSTCKSSKIIVYCQCINEVFKNRSIANELHNQLETYQINFDILLDVLFELTNRFLVNNIFQSKYNLNKILSECFRRNANATRSKELEVAFGKVIFLSKFIEHHRLTQIDKKEDKSNLIGETSRNFTTANTFNLVTLKETLFSITNSVLRNDLYYFFAITPYEIFNSYDLNLNEHFEYKANRVPSIPIDYLNEADMVEKFVRRINIFGFRTRQHFEEFFMSLLLLINKETDLDMVDVQEQYQIKNICLMAIIELLLTCKMYRNIGDRANSQFCHIPRTTRNKADTISLKKLHSIQTKFMPEPCVFYQSNLERCLKGYFVSEKRVIDSLIGTEMFVSNQYELNTVWHIIEEQQFSNSSNEYVALKNVQYFIEQSSIDFKSSLQIVFDVFTQLIEVNCVLVLPHLVKFCEICENREQIRWIKNTMEKLQENIHMENSICHEYIVYSLCKSYALLVSSLNDLNHLCTIITSYLKSTHIFVRVAALKGLLCLLESCIKTNTTIGGLNEEILLIRNLIVNYITKYGIIDESPLTYSNEHTILVWTLNFYLIETTSKFIPDCNLLANTIISANNILKRTINLDQYLCILHGLERLVVRNAVPKVFREKIEKISLDLVKLENEKFSIPALKLLVSCMYIGAAEQLENTERSNGIVQDEPEIIVQCTEKIDILFNRIKLSTKEAAQIYGNILCQLTQDLVPPKEVLTKVIKELLTLSQPHCGVIARILFQVFRSAIDSSYLPLLQDWLICSLPNFLSFPPRKTIWCLTIIFVSASINLHLIKLLPEILTNYDDATNQDLTVYQNITSANEEKSSVSSDNEDAKDEDNALETVNVDVQRKQALEKDRIKFIFSLACKDFYDHLNDEQKNRFRDIFKKCQVQEIQFMLKSL